MENPSPPGSYVPDVMPSLKMIADNDMLTSQCQSLDIVKLDPPVSRHVSLGTKRSAIHKRLEGKGWLVMIGFVLKRLLPL